MRIFFVFMPLFGGDDFGEVNVGNNIYEKC